MQDHHKNKVLGLRLPIKPHEMRTQDKQEPPHTGEEEDEDKYENPPAPSGPPSCEGELRASSFKSPDVKQ